MISAGFKPGAGHGKSSLWQLNTVELGCAINVVHTAKGWRNISTLLFNEPHMTIGEGLVVFGARSNWNGRMLISKRTRCTNQRYSCIGKTQSDSLTFNV